MHGLRGRSPWSWAQASERLAFPAYGMVVAAVVVTAMVTGCGSSGGAKPAAAVSCGTTRTAANVPVHIQVVSGQISCLTALDVERGYASAMQSGKVPGTGGGAPVQVQGWTCQGFTTPVVLKTGDASKCTKGSTEILAILPTPT
jgi:hypothetical protein